MINDNDINRLDFENYIWIVFIILSILNIIGDYFQKEFLKTNNKKFENNANNIFLIVLIVSFIIYIYFFYRNYNAYLKIGLEEKGIYLVKLIGSSLIIGGVICLLYFQINQSDFIGTPII